jgi:hypothetical protein
MEKLMHPRGKQRSVITILVLSLFTAGLYFFYWYYVNINELDSYFDFTGSDAKPKSVKKILILYITVSFIFSFFLRYGFQGQDVNISAPDTFIVFFYIVYGTLGIILNFEFLKLIDFSYDNLKMDEINFNGIFSLYVSSVVSSFFSFVSNAPALLLISGILAIIYLVVLQGKINLLWRTV